MVDLISQAMTVIHYAKLVHFTVYILNPKHKIHIIAIIFCSFYFIIRKFYVLSTYN